jgi:hypothetical protein
MIYSKTAYYTLPALSMGATYMDGIYIDGSLFDNNKRVIDGTIRIGVWPQQTHVVMHLANFGFPSFQNGRVVRIGHEFAWPAGQKAGLSYDIPYNGFPYGIGLNTIGVQLRLNPFNPIPATHDIIYKVVYALILEVE